MNRTFAGVEVCQRQFGVDNFNIVSRVNFAGNVNDVVIFKAANNVTDRFGFTDVGQELVTQTFAFRCAFYQTGDIDKFHGRGKRTLRFYDFSQLIQARIRHWYDACVRLNSAEWKVGRFNTGFGQRVEQGRFPDVGQTDDTAFESHDLNHLNILIINLLLLTDCRNGNNFAYYTRHSAKMPQTTTYCALKACNRFVALVKPSVNHISVQRAASSMASSINFCSLTGGLPNTKPTTLFLSPG